MGETYTNVRLWLLNESQDSGRYINMASKVSHNDLYDAKGQDHLDNGACNIGSQSLSSLQAHGDCF